MAPARDRRTGFSRRRQYGAFIGYVLAVAGAVVGAVLLVISTFDPPAFAALRMTLASVTSPVSSALTAGMRNIAAVPDASAAIFAFMPRTNVACRSDTLPCHADARAYDGV